MKDDNKECMISDNNVVLEGGLVLGPKGIEILKEELSLEPAYSKKGCGKMNREVINKFIAIPLAIKVFRMDREQIKDFKTAHVYLDKLDAVLVKLQEDFNILKKDMYTLHHIDIKFLGKENGTVKYKANSEVITFTPEELKAMTSDLMRDHLYGEKAGEFPIQDRIWEN